MTSLHVAVLILDAQRRADLTALVRGSECPRAGMPASVGGAYSCGHCQVNWWTYRPRVVRRFWWKALSEFMFGRAVVVTRVIWFQTVKRSAISCRHPVAEQAGIADANGNVARCG